MGKYVIARLKEASTWRGLVAMATAAGVVLSAGQIEAIIAVGMAAMGVVGAFFPDV